MTQPTRYPGRLVRAKAVKGEAQGLAWYQVYRPFDMAAYAEFAALLVEKGTAAKVAAEDPDLVERAIGPIDSQGEAMLPEDLELLAHRYMGLSRKVDVDHDESGRASVEAVESFLNTEDVASPHFDPGAWVVVLKFDTASPEWERVQKAVNDPDLDDGLGAVSLMAWVDRVKITSRVEDVAP